MKGGYKALYIAKYVVLSHCVLQIAITNVNIEVISVTCPLKYNFIYILLNDVEMQRRVQRRATIMIQD